MVSIVEVLKKIDLYFPKDIAYGTEEYRTSIQNIRLLERKKEYINCSLDIQVNNKLSEIFTEYEIINWTDLESNNCLEYKMLLHKNQKILDDDVELIKTLNGRRQDLHIFISILGPYYYYFLNNTSLDNETNEWKINKIFVLEERFKHIINLLQQHMETEGYFLINNTLANTIIENIETEFIEKENVTIFNCLFTDLVTIQTVK